MTRRVLSLLKGANASINSVLDALNLIPRLICDPKCLTRNVTNLGLPTFDGASHPVCQALSYLVKGLRCEEDGELLLQAQFQQQMQSLISS